MLATKRRVESDDEQVQVIPLGAGNEVGRSCIIVKYKGKTVMLDCGIHPARPGFDGLPLFEKIDPSTVDLVLISHFHLDHVAALPYFFEHTTPKFRGRVFMTHPTKAIFKMLLHDYIRVRNIAVDEVLYTEEELSRANDRIEVINYHQTVEHNGIRFRALNAGHVLGAAMFMIEIAGVRILYTGDFSRQEDRHMMAAELPDVPPHVLIVESTYGVQVHEPRVTREQRFTGIVYETVRRGGRCLLPVFAVGRAQELLLILDEFWEAHPELHGVPVYYASALAKKCMIVYQTYINMMNERVRRQLAQSQNPWIFKHISSLRGMEDFDDVGPCVVLASPGMLQSGLSRELFERWCSDKRNSVILPGYSVEGTLAKTILNEPTEITLSSGRRVPLRMEVRYISFSAHSDFAQTSDFIAAMKPPHVVLVHGEQNEMLRLRAGLLQRFEKEQLHVLTPRNGEMASFEFHAEKIAKVVGQLAARVQPVEGAALSGILVTKDFAHQIVAPEELFMYTTLGTTTLAQTVRVGYSGKFALVVDLLRDMFDDVREENAPDHHHSHHSPVEAESAAAAAAAEPSASHALHTAVVLDAVRLVRQTEAELTVEWDASPVNDMLADAVMACVAQTVANPAAAKAVGALCHLHDAERLDRAADVFRGAFGTAAADRAQHTVTVRVDGIPVTVDLRAGAAHCVDADLQARATELAARVVGAASRVSAPETARR